MLAIVTTSDRFGLAAPSKPWEAFETGCLITSKIKDHLVFDATKREQLPTSVTKVLILGPSALAVTHPGQDLDKFRGTLTCYQNKLAIATYHPTDAFDMTAGGDDDEADFAFEQKDSARTRPSNYFFWMRRDCSKLLTDFCFKKHPPFKAYYQPNLEKFIKYAEDYVNSDKDPIVYIDIECRREDHVLDCIGIAFRDSPVFVLPIYNYRNIKAYGEPWKVLALLNRILPRATVVVHNSLFDLFVLSRYYRIVPGRKVFDTMLCQRRLFAEEEISLGHTISYWTNLPFHKDSGCGEPRNDRQQYALWEYNAKDVYAMREVHRAQTAYLAEHPEYAAAVEQANKEVYPYLLCMLRGMNIDEQELSKQKLELGRRVNQCRTICRILSGDKFFNPGSPPQCVKYFHDKLGHEVVARTNDGRPKMDQKALYKLRIKVENPLIDSIIAYRVANKALSMLHFEPYELPSYK